MPIFFVALAILVAMRTLGSGTTLTVASIDGLVLVGLGAATFAYRPGDAPRTGWGLMFVAQAIMLLAHLGERSDGLVSMDLVRMGKILSNAVWVASIVYFVRVFGRSGLAPPWSRAQRVTIGVLGLMAVAGGASVIVLQVRGGTDMVLNLARSASTTADTVVFVGSLLLARIMLPMARGTVALPYLLLAGSGGLFLVMDFVMTASGAGSYMGLSTVSQATIAVADAFRLAAALNAAKLTRA